MSNKGHSSGAGPSQRMLRVGEVIRRAMSETLMRGEIHDPDLNRLNITVTEVRMSPDMTVATCFVMPLGGKNADEAVKAMARNVGELRRMVGRVTKLKFTPELRFKLDDTFDRMEATRKLFDNETVQRDLAAKDDPDGNGDD